MTVKAVLARKGNDVITIEPTALLLSAAESLAVHRIGAVVVIDADHRVIGILSERDIVRVISEKSPFALGLTVAHAMTRKVVTCSSGDTVAELMDKMTEGKFRHVPVVEDGKLVGIVSIGDVVKSRLLQLEDEAAALCDYIRTG